MLQILFPQICSFIEQGEEYRELLDINLKKLSLKNEFVFLIKPECFLSYFDGKKNLLKIFEYIDQCFENYHVSVLGAVIFNGQYASSRSVLENEYYVLNRGARYGLMHLAANKRDAIIKKYKDYIPISAYGFLNLGTGYTAASLEEITEVQLSDKIGNGTYVLPLEHKGKKYAIFNAFHPRQIEHFNAPTHITMALLCNTNTDYKYLADSLTGFYSPEVAKSESIRKYLYDNQQELGLTINNLYNGVHISPSPLEGILGFYRYSNKIRDNITQTYLGGLLASKYKEYQIEEFMENPTVFFNGVNMDLFEICEHKNADEIAEIIKGLGI